MIVIFWLVVRTSLSSLGLEDPGVKYHHRVKKTRLMRDIVPCDCSVEAQGPRAVKDQHLGGREKTLMKHLDPFGEYQRHSYPPKRGFAVGFWHSAVEWSHRHLPGDHLYVKLQKVKDPRHGNSVNMCKTRTVAQKFMWCVESHRIWIFIGGNLGLPSPLISGIRHCSPYLAMLCRSVVPILPQVIVLGRIFLPVGAGQIVD